MRQRGRDGGNAFADGVERAVEDRVDSVGDTFGDGLVEAAQRAGRRASDAFDDVFDGIGEDGTFNLDFDIGEEGLNRSRSRILAWAADIGRNITNTFSEAAQAGLSFFATIGRAVAQIPLPQLLAGVVGAAVIPTILGAAGVLIGLLQVLNPILALIVTLPAILAGLTAIGFTLFAVFKGMGDVISSVFAAKTYADAIEAVADLEGSARRFALQFFTVGQLWREIVAVAQKEFFAPFDGVITKTVKALRPALLYGVAILADSLGGFFVRLTQFFGSPTFIKFTEAVFPAMGRIIDRLGGPLIKALDGLLKLIIGTLPYMEWLFTKMGNGFESFSTFIDRITSDGSLKNWLNDTKTTLSIVAGMIGDIWGAFIGLLKWLNESGEGNEFLNSLRTSLGELIAYFSSEHGKEAIRGMLTLAEILIKALVGIIILFAEVGFWWDKIFGEPSEETNTFTKALADMRQKIQDFFGWFGDLVYLINVGWSSIGEGAKGVATAVGNWMHDSINSVIDFFWVLLGLGNTTFATFVATVARAFALVASILIGARGSFLTFAAGAISAVASIPSRIRSLFGGAEGWLYNAGQAVLRGFINGLSSMVSFLVSYLRYITSLIAATKGPESKDRKLLIPAGVAIMEGLQDGLRRGARGVLGDLNDLTNMIGVTANSNSFLFGPGAIQQNFNGAQPSPNAAATLGTATGNSIVSAINRQNMRAETRAI